MDCAQFSEAAARLRSRGWPQKAPEAKSLNVLNPSHSPTFKGMLGRGHHEEEYPDRVGTQGTHPVDRFELAKSVVGENDPLDAMFDCVDRRRAGLIVAGSGTLEPQHGLFA